MNNEQENLLQFIRGIVGSALRLAALAQDKLLKYKIRNPGLWPCHLNDCNSRKILILLWN